MSNKIGVLADKRIRLIVGHYGSGKTEFALNYALALAQLNLEPDFKVEKDSEVKLKIALIDLDIANPFFRSREKQEVLMKNGIKVFSDTFGHDITENLPAITASINAPLQDKLCQVVVDVGGDQAGAKILIQFMKYFISDDCDMFCVINANRPETNNLKGALYHVFSIEKETGLKITGIINNTHMLRDTKILDILKGNQLCKKLSSKLRIPIKYTCHGTYLDEELKKELNSGKTKNLEGLLFPIDLQMRNSWMDRQLIR